jgi:Protein of unknown function (DUF992)
MIRFSATIALAAGLAATISPVSAQSQVQAGMLECSGTTASFIVGSVTEMRCTFRPGSGSAMPYVATIRRVGVDVALPANVGMAWAVFAPTRNIGPGELSGTYAGASASATAVVGVGANALVGGSNNTIALQPVSLQGQTGLGVAAGVAGMELRAAR